MQLFPKPQKNGSQFQPLPIEQAHNEPAMSAQGNLQNGLSPETAHLSIIHPLPLPEERTLLGYFPNNHPNNHLMGEREHQRVVILIDGSNLFYAAANLNLEIDYVRLLQYLVQDRRLVRAYFYTGCDRTNEKQQGFLHWMRRNGYRVVAKDLIQFPDGSKKANVQVEIAVDMMTLAHHCDTIVLLSGDGNLAYAVDTVTYKGVRVEIVSLRSMTSDSLINVADDYIDLETIRQNIQRV
jgi:uncharacterized LabA/DUF88 family protein